MSKLDELKKLREKINVSINGKENYPCDAPCVIITNHNRLKDIFYLPTSIDEDIVSLISARLVYKQNEERLNVINKYLNAFPVEAHGGKVYSDICLKYASKILQSGISLSIFPEGAYLDEKDVVYRGRTGAARILFDSLDNSYFSYLLPISIDIDCDEDLDSYKLTEKDKVKINILEPIDPREYYKRYNEAYENDRNLALHDLIDDGMKDIAKSLDRKFLKEYIELYPKGNVIFDGGITVINEISKEEKYVDLYENNLKKLSLKLIDEIGDKK